MNCTSTGADVTHYPDTFKCPHKSCGRHQIAQVTETAGKVTAVSCAVCGEKVRAKLLHSDNQLKE